MDRLLAEVMAARGCDGLRGDIPARAGRGNLVKYRRILVQDSTVIQLPQHLFAAFSGVAAYAIFDLHRLRVVHGR